MALKFVVFIYRMLQLLILCPDEKFLNVLVLVGYIDSAV